MTKFTCVSSVSTGSRVTERKAQTAEQAAEQHAKALHSAYWSAHFRNGKDSHGVYQEFAINAGPRVQTSVRVYEQYK